MTAPEQVHDWCGAYACDALEPDERVIFDRHLEHCAQCRDAILDLAVLPGMIRRALPLLAEYPSGDLGAISGSNRSPFATRRTTPPRRRRRAALALAGIAAVAGSVVVVSALDRGSSANETVLSSRGSVSGAVRLHSKAWGTEIRIEVADLPNAGIFTAIAHGPGGREETVATWASTPSGSAIVIGASGIGTDELEAVVIVDVDDKELLRATRA